MSYVFSLVEKFPLEKVRKLSYPVFDPQPSRALIKRESMLKQVRKHDVILHYPFEQMEPFLRLIKEAANDETVNFKNMAISNLDGQYDHILVAPTSLKQGIVTLIDEEIAKAKRGEEGYIIMKMNSLTDREIITKLSEASCAGVTIKLIIRGICCLVPQIKDKTENVTVVSIVGRFLEHSRIYCFGQNEDTRLYISSADIMTRNTEKRVEIACPILDENIKKRIIDILEVQLHDNVKARILQSDAEYTNRSGSEYTAVDSQTYFMEEALKATKVKEVKVQLEEKQAVEEGPLRRALEKLRGIFSKK